MKYGVFGGTFDPPHLAHLKVAHAVREALDLDEVVFVPASRNPLKRRTASSAKNRMEMVKLLVEGEDGLSVSDVEVTRGGASYAVETLAELKMARPGEYWFLVGSDAVKDLPNWKDPEKLLTMTRIALVAREGDSADDVMHRLPREYSRSIDFVPMPFERVSSSKIRKDVARGTPVEHWLKPAVWEYIKKVGLYR